MEGRVVGNQTKPTNKKYQNQKTPTNPQQNTQPKKYTDNLCPSPQKTQTKPCSTKSQNMLSEDKLCGICFLKIYPVPYSKIITCVSA